ncbi:MAG: phosphatase PAP2 family protein [Promethearchaeota archaeon]
MIKNQKSQKNTFLQWIVDVDYRSAIWFYNLNPKLTPLLKIISLLGTIQFWMILSLIFFVAGVFFNQNIENLSILMLMGIGVSLLTITTLKVIVKRKRPYQDEKLQEFANQTFMNREPYISKAQQSFPSGHMFYWLMELVFFYTHLGPWALIPFLIILPLIFTSRIYLGVHYLSDVLVGSLMGIMFGFITQLIFDLYILPLYIQWVAVLF